MSIKNRQTLCQFFGEGRMPTSDHFHDLIHSTLNMRDEGFRKTAADGFIVTAPQGFEALASFCREQNGDDPLWSMSLGGSDSAHLLFKAGGVAARRQEAPVLSLGTGAVATFDGGVATGAASSSGSAGGTPRAGGVEPRVGIGTADPRQALDVRGTVASQGRMGTFPLAATPMWADGRWHDVTGDLEGCQAFEVMAGAGTSNGDASRVAMLRALAMNTFNPPGRWLDWLDWLPGRKPIRCQHAWWNQRCDRLQLRWWSDKGASRAYRLQVRSRCDYGSGVPIHVSLTRLWSISHPARVTS